MDDIEDKVNEQIITEVEESTKKDSKGNIKFEHIDHHERANG